MANNQKFSIKFKKSIVIKKMQKYEVFKMQLNNIRPYMKHEINIKWIINTKEIRNEYKIQKMKYKYKINTK